MRSQVKWAAITYTRNGTRCIARELAKMSCHRGHGSTRQVEKLLVWGNDMFFASSQNGYGRYDAVGDEDVDEYDGGADVTGDVIY